MVSYNSYPCGVTFKQLRVIFHMDEECGNRIWRDLRNEGYTERGICYAAGRAHEKILRFVGDSRFEGIFKNEVRKYALKPNDPRWKTRKKRQQKFEYTEL